ncbi:zinc ABC transporter ZnuA [Dehalogenimonas sp. WBC-2]|nr:zinc ABC transporter ZnuA [Dehalogenimonas sp. WBC-2]
MMSGCRNDNTESKSVVVTHSILGSVVKELVGDEATVTVLIPNGSDLHDWEPSARDIEKVNQAGLVVRNGLNLEQGLEATLASAENQGVKLFTATDYITVRHVGLGEGIPGDDPDQQIGAADPHFWVDPVAMKSVVTALAAELKATIGINVDVRAADLETRLDSLNSEITALVAGVAPDDRKLVTGHESMGYFADRYSFQLVGAVIPNLSTQAEVSAADIAALIKLIKANPVKAIFAESGTSAAVVQTVSDATGVQIVELTTHRLAADGSYFTFMSNLAVTIADALK